MSAKRLNKRQLREFQELQELANQPKLASQEPESEEEEQEEAPAPPASKGPTSIFAALGGEEEEDEEEPDEEEAEEDQYISSAAPVKSAKKKNKKKKKKAPAAALEEDEDGEPITPQKSQQGKKSKQAPAAEVKKGKGNAVDEMSMDDLDALLASQAQIKDKDGKPVSTAKGSASLQTGSVSSFRTHLSLDPRNLDPSIELKRQFGSAAIKAYESEAAGGRASGGARSRAQAMNPNLKFRTLLCTPKDYWPPIGRTFTGMSMDVAETESGRLCSWQHGKAYKQVQMQFLQAVRSMDPNSLMALLRVYPWHIDTLLQLSDYSRHQGDLGQAADFNDRALFAFERTASPYFSSCISSSTSGPPMIDFNKIENRAFYLSVHRNIGFLGRRGTWRTALEWAKILLGLGKDGEDHHASLLWIDFLAVKARQHQWLIELTRRLDEQRGRRRGGTKRLEEVAVPAVTPIDDEKKLAGEEEGYEGQLDWCVGLAYARALAFKAIEKNEGDKEGARSRAALRLAIARHPMAVPLLCSKIGTELPSRIAGHPMFAGESRFSTSTDTLPDLLSHIYAHRSDSLWKESGYGEWLRATAVELFDTLEGSARKPAIADQMTRQGIYRHVLVSDLPDAVRQQLVGYLPPEVTRNSEMMDAFDPVPPVASDATRYDDAYFAPIMSGQRDAAEADEGGIMQAFMRAVGGMEAMDDETREDVMAQLMQAAEQARRERGAGEHEPPGGFGLVDQPEGEQEDRGAGAGPLAAFRNALNALWGGAAEPALDPAEREDQPET